MKFLEYFRKKRNVEILPPYHTFSVERVCDELTTNVHEGLSTTQAKARLEEHGLNQLKGQGGVSASKVIFRQVANALTVVLLIALVISFVVKDWVEGGVIAFIVVLNVTIGFFQEYRAEKTLESLRKMSSPTSQVIRDGHLVTIATIELTVGDILVIEHGDVVGADCRLFQVSNLEVDEALLTGESLPVAKIQDQLHDPDEPLGDRINLVYASTTVTKGRGRAIVTGIGMRTEIGKIAKTLADTKDEQSTPLQKGLNYMTYVLFGLAVIFAIVVFAAQRFHIRTETAIYAIGLGIAMIPEGLIAVVTMTMALGVRRMTKNRALVRKLNALESLGSVTNICSDKTGTLTQSRMVLRRAWLPGGEQYEITGNGFVPDGEVLKLSPATVAGRNIRFADEDIPKETLNPAIMSPAFTQFTLCASLCNMSELKQDKVTQEWIGMGDPTETSLQVFAHKAGYAKPTLTSDNGARALPFKLVAEFPFDSGVKRMSVVYHIHDQDGTTPLFQRSNHGFLGLPASQLTETNAFESFTLQPDTAVCYLKGATERVLDCCRFVYQNDQVIPMTDEFQAALMEEVTSLATRGLRVLSLACRPVDVTTLPSNSDDWKREVIDQDMIFLGLAGIYDPPRPETWLSVQECYDAGITVHMLTGDHPATAAAIAQEVGILPSDLPLEYANRPLTITDASPGAVAISTGSNQLVVTAQEFDALPDEEIDNMVELPHVIARCSPNTKVKMIKAMHRRKRIVAMTGDGVNDSPSLKIANVGIAMGLQGSDVAKQASHIVLTDDNFATIVKAVAEGRRIFNNIQKFICHMIAANVAEVIPLLIGLAFMDASGYSVFPLSPVQILVNNMLTSTPPAMSLGVEPSSPETMKRAPRPVKYGIFSPEVIMDIFAYGSSMGVICLLNFILVVWGFGDGNLGVDCNEAYSDSCDTVFRARGTIFTTMTYMLLLHAYNCKDVRQPMWWGWWKKGERGFSERFLSNKYLLYSVTGGNLIVFPILYIPTFNTQIFKHKPITWEWGIVGGSIFVFFICSELYKLAKRRFMKPIFRDPAIPLSRMTTTISVEDHSGETKILHLSGQNKHTDKSSPRNEKEKQWSSEESNQTLPTDGIDGASIHTIPQTPTNNQYQPVARSSVDLGKSE
ncbi:hypothetical protein IWQ61_004814 [Dispira simplex]|nr:hypothetical protein IWQ61_004814 [Dispira simplex]